MQQTQQLILGRISHFIFLRESRFYSSGILLMLRCENSTLAIISLNYGMCMHNLSTLTH